MRTVRNTTTSVIDFVDNNYRVIIIMMVTGFLGFALGMFLIVHEVDKLCGHEHRCLRVESPKAFDRTIIIQGTLLVAKHGPYSISGAWDPVYAHYARPDHYVNGIPVTYEGYELKRLPPEEGGWAVRVPIRAW